MLSQAISCPSIPLLLVEVSAWEHWQVGVQARRDHDGRRRKRATDVRSQMSPTCHPSALGWRRRSRRVRGTVPRVRSWGSFQSATSCFQRICSRRKEFISFLGVKG